jgi:hypothetical protein
MTIIHFFICYELIYNIKGSFNKMISDTFLLRFGYFGLEISTTLYDVVNLLQHHIVRRDVIFDPDVLVDEALLLEDSLSKFTFQIQHLVSIDDLVVVFVVYLYYDLFID